MTVVNLTALETLLEQAGPITRGEVTATYWAGRKPFVNVAGAAVTFPAPIVVSIVDGVPSASLDMVPTGDVSCVKWEIRSFGGGRAPEPRYTLIPGTGPVNFGDLERVDPTTLTPLDPTPPTAQEVLAEAAAALGAAADAEAARAAAVQAKVDAEAAAAGVIPSTDAAMTAVAADPDSDFAIQSKATFVSVSEPPLSILHGPQAVDRTGASNSQVAIQAALDAAAAQVMAQVPTIASEADYSPIARPVYFPPGLYKTNAPLLIPPGLSIVGENAVIKAGASMSSVLYSTDDVALQSQYIRNIVIDCDEKASGVDLGYVRTDTHIDGLLVISSAAFGLRVGSPSSPATSGGIKVHGFRTYRRRNVVPAANSIGLHVRNLSDGTFEGKGLHGHDFGVMNEGSSNDFHSFHPWNSTGQTGPSGHKGMTACFKDTGSRNKYYDCYADTPGLYGFDLAGSDTVLVGTSFFLNAGGGDNIAAAFNVHGSPYVQSYGHIVWSADTSHRWKTDWQIDATDGGTLQNVLSMGRSGSYIVTKTFNIRSAVPGLYLNGDPAVAPLQIAVGTADRMQTSSALGTGLGFYLTPQGLARIAPLTSGQRPAASAAANGVIVDSATGKMLRSNGTNWVDTMGVVVY